MTEQTTDDTQDNRSKPETTPQGFVAQGEFPQCPECGHQGKPVIANGEGLQGLHCKECLQILSYIEPATSGIDDEDKHYAVVGDKAHGTGDTEEEAVENMKEYLGDNPFPVYTVYVSNKPLQVSRYGQVIGEEGSQVALHKVGRKRLRDYGGEE